MSARFSTFCTNNGLVFRWSNCLGTCSNTYRQNKHHRGNGGLLHAVQRDVSTTELLYGPSIWSASGMLTEIWNPMKITHEWILHTHIEERNFLENISERQRYRKMVKDGYLASNTVEKERSWCFHEVRVPCLSFRRITILAFNVYWLPSRDWLVFFCSMLDFYSQRVKELKTFGKRFNADHHCLFLVPRLKNRYEWYK